jgi:2-polyprenyl-6-methoxyphenol hydroxylase-like FAD-dependent oxidoreductase
VIGTEDETCLYIFPPGAGRARHYTCWMPERLKAFRGADAPRRFLDAFRFRSAPGSERFADARPAGPLQFYRTEDHWADWPMAPGVLLIGDAAGHNDPSLGRGFRSLCTTCGSSPG